MGRDGITIEEIDQTVTKEEIKVPCKICGSTVDVAYFNIKLSATPVCEYCATTIFLQQAKWYAESDG